MSGMRGKGPQRRAIREGDGGRGGERVRMSWMVSKTEVTTEQTCVLPQTVGAAEGSALGLRSHSGRPRKTSRRPKQSCLSTAPILRLLEQLAQCPSSMWAHGGTTVRCRF